MIRTALDGVEIYMGALRQYRIFIETLDVQYHMTVSQITMERLTIIDRMETIRRTAEIIGMEKALGLSKKECAKYYEMVGINVTLLSQT